MSDSNNGSLFEEKQRKEIVSMSSEPGDEPGDEPAPEPAPVQQSGWTLFPPVDEAGKKAAEEIPKFQ